MNYWKFICTWETERECMARRLVGNDKRYTPDGVKLDAREGDIIFLHRTRNAEAKSGFLLGPFTAESDAQQNIIHDAWNHLSAFSWQVEIGWEDPVYSFSVDDYHEDNNNPVVDFSAYSQQFSEIQGSFITGKLKDGDIIISGN
jgi:hypothetical protein